MALPTTREQLKDFCLRRLGHPVVQININPRQIEDRIDEAIQKYQTRHFDGSEKIYAKHQITASSLTFASATLDTFEVNETITGQASGAIGRVIDQAENNLSIRFSGISGTFQNNEEIIGSNSSASATLASANSVFIGDIDPLSHQYGQNSA